MASAAGAFRGRDEHRKAAELEEARKAGLAPAAVDEDGKEINPHIPQYMAAAPWYLNNTGPARARADPGRGPSPPPSSSSCPSPPDTPPPPPAPSVPVSQSLKHQKNWKGDGSVPAQWYDRGAKTFQATKFRKGACDKCARARARGRPGRARAPRRPPPPAADGGRAADASRPPPPPFSPPPAAAAR